MTPLPTHWRPSEPDAQIYGPGAAVRTDGWVVVCLSPRRARVRDDWRILPPDGVDDIARLGRLRLVTRRQAIDTCDRRRPLVDPDGRAAA